MENIIDGITSIADMIRPANPSLDSVLSETAPVMSDAKKQKNDTKKSENMTAIYFSKVFIELKRFLPCVLDIISAMTIMKNTVPTSDNTNETIATGDAGAFCVWGLVSVCGGENCGWSIQTV